MKLSGAEATLVKTKHGTLVKRRIKKKYRAPQLDTRIRLLRTRSESNILRHAKLSGVNAPTLLKVNEQTFEFELENIPGELLIKAIKLTNEKQQLNLCKKAGEQIAKLHNAGVVHGDCTTSNFIVKPTEDVFVIDFGLAEMTQNTEAKALDLQLFKNSVSLKLFNAFLQGYELNAKNANETLNRLEKIEQRGRYKRKN